MLANIPRQTTQPLGLLAELWTDMETRPHLGFKAVTSENVLEVDPVVATMATMDHRTGIVRPQTPDDWVPFVVAVELSANVPHEVRRAFTLAQHAMCYAHWYYPMLTLGADDLLRVADFAAAEAAREHGIRARTFEQRIGRLVSAGVIPHEDEPLWTALRAARNSATHPAFQHIYGFSHALHILNAVREVIDRIKLSSP
jgi:hypothetical protein